MTDVTQNSVDGDALAAASEWFALLRREDAGPDLWNRFCGWRDANHAHAAAYEQVSSMWSALGDVGEHPAMARLRIDALSVSAQRPSGWRQHGWAIAASLALVLFSGAMLYSKPMTETAPVAMQSAQGPGSPPKTPVVPQEVAAANPTQGERFASRYRTAVGQRASFVLPDRSRIELNTNSLVAVDFSNGRRNLRLLLGEAVFHVAHDQRRPFIVAAGKERVVALGTVFSVRKDAGSIKVTLLEGKVRVERGDTAAATSIAQLVAGEQIVVGAGQRAEISRANLATSASWREGRLIFDNQPLSAVVTEINRYSNIKLQVGDPAIATMKISATLRIGSAENFANALSASFPVRLARQRGDTILILPDANNGASDAGITAKP